MKIALLAALIGAARGHTMGMCTMTSLTIPNRAVVMMPNYHAVDMATTTTGNIKATTLGGDVFTFNFTDKCSPASIWDSSVGSTNEIDKITDDMRATTNSMSCGNQIVGGKAVSDVNSVVTCYTPDAAPQFSSLNFAWDNGPTQQQLQCYSGRTVESYYLLVLDNLPPATYVFSGTTDSMDLSPGSDVPCTVVGTPMGTYGPDTFIDISVSDGATSCTSTPTFPANTLASSQGRCTPSHANAGGATSFVSGFLCPVKCETNYQKTGMLICRNGAWVSTVTCTQDACLRPLTGGSGNALSIDAGTNGLIPTTTCGIYSAVGSVCGFTCAGTSFGCGSITCGSGNAWARTSGASDQCITSSNDVVTLAPSTTVNQLSSNTIKIVWTKPTCSASAACCSPIERYTFSVSGYTVNCPDYLGSDPPSSGITCNIVSGPTFDSTTDIVVDAYAVNAMGASAQDSTATTSVTPSVMAADNSVTYVPTAGPTTSVPTSTPTAAPTSPTSAPTAVPTATPTSAPTSAPSVAPTAAPTLAPVVDLTHTHPELVVISLVPIIVMITLLCVIVVVIVVIALVCLRKKRKMKIDVKPVAEMVVLEAVVGASVVSMEEQIANECATKYPLIKVDLAHGHLIPLKSLEFLPNSADPQEPELFDNLLQQLGACMILANDHLPDERDINLVIGGHTDCPKEKATTSYFIDLSKKRAESVKAHLMQMHPELDASHLYPKGYGGARPIPGAIVGEGDRPNMRITFETSVASAVGAIVAAEVVYEGLE